MRTCKRNRNRQSLRRIAAPPFTQGRLARPKNGLRAAKDELLSEYMDTDMTPNEILLASERLASFEELGMEPADLAELVRRDTAKEATVSGEDRVLICTACGHFRSGTKEYAIKFPFCEKCGQRTAVPRE